MKRAGAQRDATTHPAGFASPPITFSQTRRISRRRFPSRGRFGAEWNGRRVTNRRARREAVRGATLDTTKRAKHDFNSRPHGSFVPEV